MEASLASLKANLTEEEKATVDYLVDCGQENVLLNLKEVDSVREFIKEIRVFDNFYPGGLKKYVEKCRDLLLKSSKGVNPFDGWTPSVPPVVNIDFNTKEYHELEAQGFEELTHCGFVLIAGGLGERLGYNSIKVGLPIETFTNLTYLSYYIKKILAIQHRSKNPDCILPFAIMTSENNHDITVNFLKSNNYFGMRPDQVYVMMQDCIPAVRNMDGEIAVNEKGQIIKKPHGHGDIHFCMYRDHIVDQWLDRYDLRRIFFFQDTNTVNFHTMPCVAALSVREGAHMVSTCVKRRPHEQTGGLCKLRHINGDEMVCNVEYNQLEDVISNTIDPRGDFADESGYSPFPGNCNNLCMDIRAYREVIGFSRGIVPEFVNPKYKPGSKTEYLQPTRLESLMQDYPKLLLEAGKSREINRKCIVATFPRFMAWSPVKNDYVRAAALKAKTGFEESPRSGEADIQELFRREMISINDCPVCNAEGKRHVHIEEGAHICLWPESGCTTEEIHSHLGDNVVIRKGSVLVIRCRDWFLDNVEIDGCCVIGDEHVAEGKGYKGKVMLKNVKIHNKGWHYYNIDAQDMSIDIIPRMRGYKVMRNEQLSIAVKADGDYCIKDVDIDGTCTMCFE